MGMVWYAVRYGVWRGTVCDIINWYDIMVRLPWWIHMEKSRYFVWFARGMV